MTALQQPLAPSYPLDLRRWGTSPALVTEDGGEIGYDELHERVEARRAELGPVRRLVVLETANRVDSVVDHLAALAGGHPALLVAPGAAGPLVAAYDPDVVLGVGGLEERRAGTRHDLHPELALLLGTSGSTGSAKQVRLSADNLRANAAAIASYLRLGPDDRGATSLPLHYCYGLSVLHSHLAVGASVWLSEGSVVDDSFWAGFAAAGATSFAGVPHTFDLLERSGFAERVLPHLPRLRRMTQAGGALPADRVRAWAERGERHGVDLVVMYGATEATARMAYLPPHLATTRPGTIGVPVPGGELAIDDGELVYRGPNVMLGYAHGPADLALGRTVHELRTGDLGVQHDDGLFEVTGRRSRLAKLFGLRVDLDHAERLLASHGLDARVLEAEGRLVAFVRGTRSAQRRAGESLAALCLPAHAVQVVRVADFPLTGSGKTDYPALARHAPVAGDPGDDVREVYAAVLGRPDATDADSFVSLGGDSLSFVEVSVRLERLLGELPADWPQSSIATLTARLADPPRPSRRWTARVDTGVALRAAAIVMVVGSHTEWFSLMGGAHLLLALVGFNLARFQLAPGDPGPRLARSLRDLLVPSLLWVGGVALFTGAWSWSAVALLTNAVGPPRWTDDWQLWFLEAVAWTTVGLLAVLRVPAVRRLERTRPWAFALSWLGLALALRLVLTGVEAEGVDTYRLPLVLWCVALGVVVARADTAARRVVASVLVVVSTAGFFGDPGREAVVVGGLLLLLWVPRLVVPRGLPALLAPLAAASLWIYLTHWLVYPPLDADHDVLAALASLAVGVAAWALWARATRALRRSPTRHRC